MGVYEVEKPMVPKELIKPALMIMSAANAFKPCALSQDTSNPASYPAINRRKGPFVAMFVVFEPSPKGTIDLFDDHCQAMAITAPSLGADGVFELLETLLSRPAGASLKVVPEEVKSLPGGSGIYHLRLIRMQVQIGQQRAYHRPLRASLFRGPEGRSFQDALFKESLNQFQHSTVCNIATYIGHQRFVGDTVEGRHDILPTSKVFRLK
jgi:hypothetical protein